MSSQDTYFPALVKEERTMFALSATLFWDSGVVRAVPRDCGRGGVQQKNKKAVYVFGS